MANFNKTIDKDGREFIEINGKLFPCRTLKPHEMFTDGEEGLRRFQNKMREVHEEYLLKSWKSWLKVRDIILR
jgi:hypothetical protein